jgi:hypothetical protein
MRKTLLMTTGLAWLALTGAAGAATVTLTQGPQDPLYFDAAPLHSGNFTIGTTVWSSSAPNAALTETGSLQGQYALPLGMGTTQYMSVFGGGTETATFATPQTSISIYWGSIDPGNSFVTIGGYTLSGADLMSMYGATADGSHTSPTSNELVTITGLGPFMSATFSSTQNSFEFSIGNVTPAIPEPSTWAMMMVGFAGLGYAAFRRSSKSQPLAM